MAPKKLTDCPENLRESIDWLIQVRHGSGNGLEHLAKALENLIEEAIGNAYTTNVDALLKVLDPAKSYNCCKDNVAKIGELKGTKNLENKNFSDLKTKSENIKKCYKSHLDASQQKAYVDIVSRLEQLLKLKESLTALTDDKQCKDLLTNLCSGLEIFLGFDSATKGYNGSGIVYSDLDRLCDGVMAFLKGALESVKKDDAIKTYDGCIKRYSDRLDKLLEKLKSSIGKGSADFCKRVKDVSEWLGRYRVELNGKIGSITGPLYGLKIRLEKELKGFKIEDHKEPKGMKNDEYKQKFNAKNVEAKVEQCLLRARNCIQDIFETENSGLKALDAGLQRKIGEPLKIIRREFYKFQGSSDRDTMRFYTMKKVIGDQLKELRTAVDEDIGRKIEELQQHLTSGFATHIQKPIIQVNKDLQNVFNDVGKWIDRAKQIAEHGIQQAQKILNEVSEVTSIGVTRQKVKAAADALRSKADKLYDAAANAKMHVGNLVVTVPDMIAKEVRAALVSDLQELKNKCKGWVQEYFRGLMTAKWEDGLTNGEGSVSDLKERSKKLQEWIKEAKNDDSLRTFLKKSNGVLHTLTTEAFKTLIYTLDGLKKTVLTTSSESFFGSMSLDAQDKVEEMYAHLSSLSDIPGNQLTKHFDTTRVSTIDENIEKFKSTVMNADLVDVNGSNQDTKIDKQTFHTMFKQVEMQLSTLMSTIKGFVDNEGGGKDPKGVKNYFEELNKMINTEFGSETDKHLDKIKERIEGILKINGDGNMKKILDNAAAFLRTIEQQSKQTIRDIKNTLDEEVSKKIKNITDQAEAQYVDSRIHEMIIFNNVVQKQYALVDTAIKADKATGIKGLMKAMCGGKHTTAQSRDTTLLEQLKTKTNLESAGTLSMPSKKYLDAIVVYVWSEINRTFESPDSPKHAYIGDINKIKDALDFLLKFISNTESKYNFDHEFLSLLDSLTTSLTSFNPSMFGATSCPPLDALKKGLLSFTKQLSKVYVNTYAGVKWEENYEHNYARICFSIFPLMLSDLSELKREISGPTGKWKTYVIYSPNEAESLNALFFSQRGYDVGRQSASVYGELNHKEGFNAEKIVGLLKSEHQTKYDILASLLQHCTHISTYHKVRHLRVIKNATHPCSIFDMLCWLGGLQYNSVYEALIKHCYMLHNNEKDALLKTKLWEVFSIHLPRLSWYSQTLLTTFVGTGDARTLYCCQYIGNCLGLYYPSTADECFDMLLDILRRLFPVLRFVQSQCSIPSTLDGWRECRYGKDIPTTKSQYKSQSTEQAMCQQNCQPTSPLMRYLNDCLPGYLPHHLTSVGCRSECETCLKSVPGMPCLTPLGFRAFSGSTKTGKDLAYTLDRICGDKGMLAAIYSSLTCYAARPPVAFPDIFSFYCQLTQQWTWMPDEETAFNTTNIQKPISDKIIATVACDYNAAENFLRPCRELNRSTAHDNHNMNDDLDLKYLIGCKNDQCGNYIDMLNRSAYSIFAPKHADKYLSWLLYVCPRIVVFLKRMKEAYSDISCYDTGCRGCLNDDFCMRGKHGCKPCGCMSMVQCKGVASVFYQYGLTFRDASDKSKKQCFYFRESVDRILKSKLLVDFLSAIDTFMFTIRAPFIWTVVALWSLSLLYLFYVMVGRLDLLHIRSHLRSPSSHRISAQSLLAAARVGKLSKISYLQA